MRARVISAIMGMYLLSPLCCAAAEPRLKWTFSGASTLYGPPIVADIHPSPGEETLVADSAVRRLRCVDAEGRQLWEYGGGLPNGAGWTKRLTAAPSVSLTARPGRTTVIVGNGDGRLDCLDGETGHGLWQRQVGKMEWGVVLWADIDGDGHDEAVAGTESDGIAAFEADGGPLWTYRGSTGAPALFTPCPLGAADVDEDGKTEVFVVDRRGPVCLNGNGKPRWAFVTADEYLSAPVIADLDGDGSAELLCAARNDNFVCCLTATTGVLMWKSPMIGPVDVYPGSSLAVGDLDGDGMQEIVIADGQGYVHCLRHTGERLWLFPTNRRAGAAATLGDVDGDGAVDVLVACEDHSVYCLDSSGMLTWRYVAELRLMAPPTLADIDRDGKSDILFCGSDTILRCLTMDARYVPEYMPWPSRRYDAAQTGSSFAKKAPSGKTVRETKPLFLHGGFELGKSVGPEQDYPSGLREPRVNQPREWFVEQSFEAAADPVMAPTDHVCCRDRATRRTGGYSARVVAPHSSVVLRTAPMELGRGLVSVSASVYAKGAAAAAACLRWQGPRGLLAETPLAKGAADADGWQPFLVKGAVPPRDARWLELVCTTAPANGEPTWWDDADVLGTFNNPRVLRALVNQVGYDVGAPKRFTVQSNFEGTEATFEIVTGDGQSAFVGKLQPQGRITGAYGNDWGYFYWRGDFTDFDAPGVYRIRVFIDDNQDVSWPFEIDNNLIWTKTARPAYRFFYYQRCGTDVPGFHKACHLDDAASPDGARQYTLWGGWHDAGDYNTYDNAPHLLRLVQAYTIQKERFDPQDEDGNGISDLLDEIMWGADHERRMVAPDGSAYGVITSGYGFWGPPELETDNIPGTGDERRVRPPETGNDSSHHAAALARIARYVKDNAPFVEAAVRGLQWALHNNKRGHLQLSAALDLYAVTGKQQYAALARELSANADVTDVETVQLYDRLFQEDHTDEMRTRLVTLAEEMLTLSDNPFGIYTYGPKEKPNFFGTPADQGGWHVGNSSHVLNAANTVAMAYQFAPDSRYLVFVYDQFNWILGNNPFDLSLMEGSGSAFPPTYHHRYAFAGVPRGAVPGSVVNGITWRQEGDDRPYFDMRGLDIPDFESNEVWLPHNTAYLNALANLQRARDARL